MTIEQEATSPIISAQDKLARDGGTPVRMAPSAVWPAYGQEEIDAASAVLRSAAFSNLSGDRVETFESEWARWQGRRHAIAVNNGTAAIHVALIAAGVGPGDEVVVTPHSFVASVTPVLHQGATPIFADIDRRTFNLTAATIERVITPQTKAIIAVHLNGHPAEPDAITALARSRGVVLIEDSAQAHGARWDGRLVGTFGELATYSFWEDKILTTAGEGGMVVTDDDNLARRARMIINHGEAPAEEQYRNVERLYYHEVLGYNYRMTEVMGAIGSVQLRRLPEYLTRRAAVAQSLTDQFADVMGIETPYVDPRAVHAFYKYIVLLDRNVVTAPVEDVVGAIRAEGIGVSRRYPTPIHLQPILRERGTPPSLPVAEAVGRDAIRITVNPAVSDDEIRDTVQAFRKVLQAYS